MATSYPLYLPGLPSELPVRSRSTHNSIQLDRAALNSPSRSELSIGLDGGIVAVAYAVVSASRCTTGIPPASSGSLSPSLRSRSGPDGRRMARSLVPPERHWLGPTGWAASSVASARPTSAARYECVDDNAVPRVGYRLAQSNSSIRLISLRSSVCDIGSIWKSLYRCR